MLTTVYTIDDKPRCPPLAGCRCCKKPRKKQEVKVKRSSRREGGRRGVIDGQARQVETRLVPGGQVARWLGAGAI